MNNIKIGVIYYIDDLNLHEKLDYIEYIKTNSLANINLKNKPTLIIGWKLVKTKFDNINILNKKINGLCSWTFSFSEKKGDYVHDLNKFLKNNIIGYFNRYSYKVLSPIFFNDLTDENNYIKYLSNFNIDNIFLSNNMQLNILSDNNIYRIDLNELKFYKINVKKILFYLKNRYNIIYDNNLEIENYYFKYFKNIDENIISKYLIVLTND